MRAFVVVLLVAWTLLAACGGDAVELAELSNSCVHTSDCKGGLACVFGLCHVACDKSSDCPAPSAEIKVQRCVRGNPNVCLLDDESACVVDADCPLGTVCGVDRQCRTGCGNAADCPQEQVCSYRTCADRGELGADGQLPVIDATTLIGEPCTRNSECTSYLRCSFGTCGYECNGPVDCSAGYACTEHLCVAPAPSGCVPATCENANANCGDTLDGCGGVLHCDGGGPGDHGCPQGQRCGGGGVPNQCGAGACQAAASCGDLECGLLSDGCALVLTCGSCLSSESCAANRCVCTPAAQPCVDGACGITPDGCGGTVDCGDRCAYLEKCETTVSTGGHCACVPKTCANAQDGGPVECGTISDGCGHVLDCNVPGCPAGLVCGRDQNGTHNRCTTDACTGTATCPDGVNRCDLLNDNCAGTISCGTCNLPEVCGGSGQDGVCGCKPYPSCAAAGASCGTIDDGCGAALDCGACGSGACVDHRCHCTPKTCAQVGADCGIADDGCGGRVQCGVCNGTDFCGASVPNHCGPAVAPGRSCGGAGGACAVAHVGGGAFERAQPWDTTACGASDPPVASSPGFVSPFDIDVLPISQKRFSAFLGSAALAPPARYAGRNPHVSPLLFETGWLSEWDDSLPTSRADFVMQYTNAGKTFADTSPDPVELTWFEANAFCIWEGARLPSDAEWLYVAYEGPVGRVFPWAASPTRATPFGTTCPPAGTATDNDAYGVQKLGLEGEWVFDAANGSPRRFDPPSCASDCVDLGYGSRRRYTTFGNGTFRARGQDGPTSRYAARCVHQP